MSFDDASKSLNVDGRLSLCPPCKGHKHAANRKGETDAPMSTEFYIKNAAKPCSEIRVSIVSELARAITDESLANLGQSRIDQISLLIGGALA